MNLAGILKYLDSNCCWCPLLPMSLHGWLPIRIRWVLGWSRSWWDSSKSTLLLCLIDLKCWYLIYYILPLFVLEDAQCSETHADTIFRFFFFSSSEFLENWKYWAPLTQKKCELFSIIFCLSGWLRLETILEKEKIAPDLFSVVRCSWHVLRKHNSCNFFFTSKNYWDVGTLEVLFQPRAFADRKYVFFFLRPLNWRDLPIGL